MRKVSQEEFHKAISTGEDCVIRRHREINRTPWYRRHSDTLVGYVVQTDDGTEYELWEHETNHGVTQK